MDSREKEKKTDRAAIGALRRRPRDNALKFKTSNFQGLVGLGSIEFIAAHGGCYDRMNHESWTPPMHSATCSTSGGIKYK